MDSFRSYLEATDADLDTLIIQLRTEYPGITLFVYRGVNNIHIQEIRLPKELRGQGIGSKVIKTIQEYAKKVDMPITLSPEADKGYKAKLMQFYKNLGFKPNKGRYKDYSLGSMFGMTMVWRPREG
jgi:GNAT superfamily N-acetyltransferase